MRETMPALLIDAYGANIAREMQTSTSGGISRSSNRAPKKGAKKRLTETTAALGTASTPEPSNTATPEPSNTATGAQTTTGGGGVYEIHVTIGRDDCHLLCLFIGVFTLAVLFNSNPNKRGPAAG